MLSKALSSRPTAYLASIAGMILSFAFLFLLRPLLNASFTELTLWFGWIATLKIMAAAGIVVFVGVLSAMGFGRAVSWQQPVQTQDEVISAYQCVYLVCMVCVCLCIKYL